MLQLDWLMEATMKKKGFLAFLTACTLILSICPVRAESSENNLTTSFRVTDIALPTMYHSCNNDFRHTGTGAQSVVWYGDNGYWRQTVSLNDGSPFNTVYRYVCEGGGGTAQYANNNMMTMDIPTASLLKEGEQLELNDGMYLAIYYRSRSEFTSPISGETKQGEDVQIQPAFMHNSNWSSNGARALDMASGENKPTLIADGEWHKLELVSDVNADMLTRATTAFSQMHVQIMFGDLTKPSYIEFGAAQAGLLKTDKTLSDNSYSRIYTETSWHLKNTAPKEFKVNGTTVKVTDDVYEYTAMANSVDNPVIEAVSDSAMGCAVEKITNTKYKVTMRASGYNSLKPLDGVTTYKKRIDTATGEYKANGTVELFNVTNADMMKEYIINLDVPTAEAKIRIGSMETNDLTGCGLGDTVTADVKYTNIESKKYNYITFLVLRKGQKVVGVIPYKVSVAEDEAEKNLTHSYPLPAGDYTDVKASCYVIDTETNSNVLN